jgi:hypothetical protein
MTRAERRAERREENAAGDALFQRWQRTGSTEDWKAWNEWGTNRRLANEPRRRRNRRIAVVVVILVGGTAFGLQAWRHSREEFPRRRPEPTTTTLSRQDRNEFCQEFPENCVPPDQDGGIP